ncbi:unnamed protein product [Ixodes hexagonus]
MKLQLVIAVSACLSLACLGDDPKASSNDFPPSSPLSMLRKAIFGSRDVEERFIDRVAAATQRLAAIVSNPVVTRALRRYYVSLLRSPDFKGLVKSIDAGAVPGSKPSNATLTSTHATSTTSAPSRTAASTKGTTDAASTAGSTSAPTRPTSSTKGTTDAANAATSTVQYKYYFDPELVTLPGHSDEGSTTVTSITATSEHQHYYSPKMASKPQSTFGNHIEDNKQHMNVVRWDDVDSCISFLVCEMSRVPWRYGSFGVKVERFFR